MEPYASASPTWLSISAGAAGNQARYSDGKRADGRVRTSAGGGRFSLVDYMFSSFMPFNTTYESGPEPLSVCAYLFACICSDLDGFYPRSVCRLSLEWTWLHPYYHESSDRILVLLHAIRKVVTLTCACACPW